METQRVKFDTGKQKEFIKLIERKLKLSSTKIANLVGISSRSFRDWKREKYLMTLKSINILSKKAQVPMPKDLEIKNQFWYTQKGGYLGGLAVYKKYGIVGGNSENRKQKWYEWWEKEGRFKKHPIIGITKPITKPKPSPQLAEFAGIMIGDGGMTKNQIIITVGRVDEDYSYYIEKLLKRLFSVRVSRYYLKNSACISIVVSRRELVLFCNQVLGLKIGNKLKQNLDIPAWVKGTLNFEINCVRGLIDTDGCIFNEVHKIKSKTYSYKRLNFTSYSPQLRQSVFNILNKLGLEPRMRNNKAVQVE